MQEVEGKMSSFFFLFFSSSHLQHNEVDRLSQKPAKKDTFVLNIQHNHQPSATNFWLHRLLMQLRWFGEILEKSSTILLCMLPKKMLLKLPSSNLKPLPESTAYKHWKTIWAAFLILDSELTQPKKLSVRYIWAIVRLKLFFPFKSTVCSVKGGVP